VGSGDYRFVIGQNNPTRIGETPRTVSTDESRVVYDLTGRQLRPSQFPTIAVASGRKTIVH
jgi:hypothetical protein